MIFSPVTPYYAYNSMTNRVFPALGIHLRTSPCGAEGVGSKVILSESEQPKQQKKRYRKIATQMTPPGEIAFRRSFWRCVRHCHPFCRFGLIVHGLQKLRPVFCLAKRAAWHRKSKIPLESAREARQFRRDTVHKRRRVTQFPRVDDTRRAANRTVPWESARRFPPGSTVYV